MHASDIAAIITAVTGLVVAVAGLVGLILHRNSANTRLGNLEAGAGQPPAQGQAPEPQIKLSACYQRCLPPAVLRVSTEGATSPILRRQPVSREYHIEVEGRRIPVAYEAIVSEVTCDGCHKPIEASAGVSGTVLLHVAGYDDLVGAFDAHRDHVTSAATACFNSMMHPVMA